MEDVGTLVDRPLDTYSQWLEELSPGAVNGKQQ